MWLEKTIQNLIYVHATLGGIALLTGAVALVAFKGSFVHKTAGKVFFFSMLCSTIIAFFIALMPNHENAFLCSIGIFSCYLLITGYRSLYFKRKNFSLKIDRVIASLIIVTGGTMTLFPLLLTHSINKVLLAFGIASIIFGIRDFINFNNKRELKRKWLKLHLGKMTGGYIAAVSAFFVVNHILPGLYNWLIPSIIGLFFIAYWLIKLGLKETPQEIEAEI